MQCTLATRTQVDLRHASRRTVSPCDTRSSTVTSRPLTAQRERVARAVEVAGQRGMLTPLRYERSVRSFVFVAVAACVRSSRPAPASARVADPAPAADPAPGIPQFTVASLGTGVYAFTTPRPMRGRQRQLARGDRRHLRARGRFEPLPDPPDPDDLRAGFVGDNPDRAFFFDHGFLATTIRRAYREAKSGPLQDQD
jgi:hypothetical protein